MLYTVRERTREIGTLKAIGFSNATVMSQFLIEGIFLSVIAGVVGIAIGVLAAPKFGGVVASDESVWKLYYRCSGRRSRKVYLFIDCFSNCKPRTNRIIFGAAVALGALGSLYPAWRAAKIKPAEAMKYE